MTWLFAKFGGVGSRAFNRWNLFAVVAISLTLSPALEMRAAALQTSQYIGAVGCKSSSCHGGAGENRGQYLTWTQQDFHSRAYAILVTPRSARMAEALSLPGAPKSERCTVCHSPFQAVAPARRAATAQVDEGVSCESCHAAAGSWLRGHTRTDWNYATRVGAGMRDLRSLYVRANTCVACHQNLDADLLQAGHPELTFELDGQAEAEPRHWRAEDPANRPRAWLVGQAVALREMSWALAKNETPDGAAAARWSALVWLLAQATAHQASLQAIDLPAGPADRATFAATQEKADLLARQAAAFPWDESRRKSMLAAVAATESGFVVSSAAPPDLLFPRAARLVLALDRLAQPVGQPATVASLSALFADVRARADFQPTKFAADLATFRTTLERAPE